MMAAPLLIAFFLTLATWYFLAQMDWSRAFAIELWNMVIYPIRPYWDYLQQYVADAFAALNTPDLAPIADALKAANHWVPLSEMFVLAGVYFVTWSVVVVIRWIIKLIPAVG